MTNKIEQDEWIRRYKQRLLDTPGVTQALADAEFEGAGFEYLSDGFEDDPEGAAVESMSYWED